MLESTLIVYGKTGDRTGGRMDGKPEAYIAPC